MVGAKKGWECFLLQCRVDHGLGLSHQLSRQTVPAFKGRKSFWGKSFSEETAGHRGSEDLTTRRRHLASGSPSTAFSRGSCTLMIG